jgi:excisionase family DNA binding protein
MEDAVTWFTTSDVARLLDVSEGTIRRWERCGKLRAERISSGMQIVHRNEIDRLRTLLQTEDR